MAPKDARAVSAITFLQKLNGNKSLAMIEQISGVFPSVCIHVIHLMNASVELGIL
jgi:hypothetical protein